MVLNRFLLPVVGMAVAALGLAACTAATPNATPSASTAAATTASQTTPATPTVTPTPSQTLDADQAAALEVAESYEAALAKVRANPTKYGQYKMIELLKPLAYDDMIQANLNGIRTWRDKGWHEEGSQVILQRDADQANAMSDGTMKVSVTICKDQRDLAVVDKNGKKVTAKAAQGPDFLQNTYDMRRAKGSGSFKVYEFGGDAVEGCAS